MKAKNAKPGQFIVYHNGVEIEYGVICVLKGGLCRLDTGSVISADLVVKMISEHQSFYIPQETYEKLCIFECEDYVQIPSGEKILFLEIPISHRITKIHARIVPVFYDSRMQVFWSDKGEMFSRRKYIAIDLEVVDDGFAMTLEGLEKIEKYYPQDI